MKYLTSLVPSKWQLTLLLIVSALAISIPTFAAFLGHNGKIAFSRNGEGIYTMNSDGSEETSLMEPGFLANAWHPLWSADGSKIVFFTQGNQYVYTMNADGTNIVQLTSGIEGSFSPDGTQIVLDTRDHRSISKINADGTNKVQLFEAPLDMALEGPVWSPDGTKIVFDMWVRTSVGKIYLL